jgi:hypothetical protein
MIGGNPNNAGGVIVTRADVGLAIDARVAGGNSRRPGRPRSRGGLQPGADSPAEPKAVCGPLWGAPRLQHDGCTGKTNRHWAGWPLEL